MAFIFNADRLDCIILPKAEKWAKKMGKENSGTPRWVYEQHIKPCSKRSTQKNRFCGFECHFAQWGARAFFSCRSKPVSLLKIFKKAYRVITLLLDLLFALLFWLKILLFCMFVPLSNWREKTRVPMYIF